MRGESEAPANSEDGEGGVTRVGVTVAENAWTARPSDSGAEIRYDPAS